jgi:uncharacterized protein YggE
MNPKIIFICLIFAVSSFRVKGQQGGNSVYGDDYTKGKFPSRESLFLSDSTFIIEANVLENVIADGYVATFGLDESGATLKECSDKIDKRIRQFSTALTKMGVAKTDMYIDLTTQNKIYDYKINGDVAEEYLQGFELKKNVIVKFNHMGDLDKMILEASDAEIYDLVKVDYIVNDLNAIHLRLFKEATDIIDQKKAIYAAATHAILSPMSEIYGDQFYSFYPNQLYQSYLAYETGNVSSSGYDSSYRTKDLRKSATYYYDKINYSGFDKVINPYVTEPAVEFVLTLQIKFEME